MALYGKGGHRWAMTERGRAAVTQSADLFQVGNSSMRWEDGRFIVDIHERSTPRLTPVIGRVVVTPEALTPQDILLDPRGRHIWKPFAPRAHIDVSFERPSWHWTGEGYLDGNFGTAAMEADFRYWTWARAPHGQGAAALYDVDRRDGSTLALAVKTHADGRMEEMEPPPRARLPRTVWGIRRETRADHGTTPRIAQFMEDVPFYSRSGLTTSLWGDSVRGVHEALDLNRFRSPMTKCLLPFRMPRARGAKPSFF